MSKHDTDSNNPQKKYWWLLLVILPIILAIIGIFPDLLNSPSSKTSDSSIHSDGSLVIEATGNGEVNVITGNGQVQQTE